MDKIISLRDQIDEIDDQIMTLLDKRFQLSKEIGNRKQLINVTVLDSNREQDILIKTTKYNHFPQIESIYHTILEESKNVQRK